jgi:hypothetical protein
MEELTNNMGVFSEFKNDAGRRRNHRNKKKRGFAGEDLTISWFLEKLIYHTEQIGVWLNGIECPRVLRLCAKSKHQERIQAWD